MAETFKDKVEEATGWGKGKADPAGNHIEEGFRKVAHNAKETFGSSDQSGTVADIREYMDVIGACGNKLGRVDRPKAVPSSSRRTTARTGSNT